MDYSIKKISFDELLKEYSLPDLKLLKIYLKEVWRVIFLLFTNYLINNS
jgi:hypothetical protein